MQKTTWITVLWLNYFGTGILCDKNIVVQQFSTIPIQSNNSCSALNEFKCNSGECINSNLKCDGARDCIDGFDEEMCSSIFKVIPIKRSLRTLRKRDDGTTCVIPFIEGNMYSDNSQSRNILSHGDQVDELSLVHVSCEPSYYKDSKIDLTIVCLPEGKWSAELDNLCLKMCSPKNSDSLDLTCTYNGKDADCSKPSQPGTILAPKCKSTHYFQSDQPEPTIELQCDENGMWVGEDFYSCQPKCGQDITEPKLLIVNGTVAKHGSAPWNVGIYRFEKEKNGYDMICGGTLISPNLVVSAAHCFWDEDEPETTITNIDGRYKITVGKFTRDIKNKMDNKYTQFIDLKFVFLKYTYKAIDALYADDIAIIVLQTNAIVSTIVSPACMYWKNYNILNIESGSLGKVVGWGVTEKGSPSPVLLQTILKFIERYDCQSIFPGDFQKYITNDKFCASDSTGYGGFHSGDSGAGLAFRHDNVYYLGGVVSSKEQSGDNAVALFTDVRYHIDWVTQIYNDFSRVTFNQTRICSKYRNSNPTYRKLCSRTPVTINQRQTTSSKVTVTRKPQVTTKLHRTTTPSVPMSTICGKAFVEPKLLIINGTTAKYGSAPWNVGLCQQRNNDPDDYFMMCGGSLISSNLVISEVANCFSDDEASEATITINNNKYKIAVGKYSLQYKLKDNMYTEIFDIQIVHLPETYSNNNGIQIGNIAVIVLKTKVTFSQVVSPVCIDWDQKYTDLNGSTGKVVGWGITEHFKRSPTLLEKYFTYIDRNSCHRKLQIEYRKYLTLDKFCANTDMGRAAVGDEGAGLTIEHENSYYLTGILSYTFDTNIFTLFTDVHRHIDWIQELYTKYSIN